MSQLMGIKVVIKEERITGWDVSNPPEVERAFRVGYRTGAERCLRLDLWEAEAFFDRMYERRASLNGRRHSDFREAILRGAAHGSRAAMEARVTGVRMGLLSWLSMVDAWANENPPLLDWDHARPPELPEPDGPCLDKMDVPPWVWFEICGGPAPRPTVTACPSPAPASALEPGLKLTRADRIEMRPPDWLLRGVLERDAFALIFGDPGCGKSFLAIDWACRVATGTPWRGHVVKAGPVVYVAGEGQQGFGRRIRAWSEHHGVSLDGAPLYLAPAVAMPDPGDLKGLLAAIDTGIDAVGQCPALIVLDTLARNFGGGDENATQDMSRFVLACDAVRRRYGCTILVVHHTGHADKSRARGAIALKAALDAEYRLTNEDRLLLTATKMKEAELPPSLAMSLVGVELPGLVDEDGVQVTSAVIDVLDADTSTIVAKTKASSTRRGRQLTVGLEIAKRLVQEGDDGCASLNDWHDACMASGMEKSTRYSVLARLQSRGDIVIDGNELSLA